MSVAELLPAIQSLPRVEKLELIRLLAADLARQELAVEPLPPDFPPPGDQCPSSREDLARMRAEPGVYQLGDILRTLGST